MLGQLDVEGAGASVREVGATGGLWSRGGFRGGADLTSRTGALDFLLTEVTGALQLTGAQVDRLESAYAAVAAWLEEPGTPLARFRPLLVYPQGSAAIGTSVRPRGRDEFDLDFVLEVSSFTGSPMELYELLLKRLEAHGVYSKMVERKRRCVRLNYEGDFHADILSSRTVRDGSPPGSIEVPDRETPNTWSYSNPRGFKRWFDGRSASADAQPLVARALPLPSTWDADSRTVLQRIVQLVKRQRDVVLDEAVAPPSIVLTTLLAEVYAGQTSLYEGLASALDEVELLVERSRPRLVVLNPTNRKEDFSEKWDEEPESCRLFVSWLSRFRSQVHSLSQIEGLERLSEALAVLFGEDVSHRAMHSYQKEIAAARSANEIRVVGPAILSGGRRGRVVPPNRNFGADH